MHADDVLLTSNYACAIACRGKTVPQYHASMDMGAYVVILNAEKVVVSGNKFETKMYRRHTGRPGSLKEETFKKLQAVRRCTVLALSIQGFWGVCPSAKIRKLHACSMALLSQAISQGPGR